MAKDPFTLVVALDADGHATGDLYLDDGHSFEYQRGAYAQRTFSFHKGVFHARAMVPLSADQASTPVLPPSASFSVPNTIERISILGLTTAVNKVTLSVGGVQSVLEFSAEQNGRRLVVRKPDVSVLADFTITLE